MYSFYSVLFIMSCPGLHTNQVFLFDFNLQAEEETKLRARVSSLDQELASEKSRGAELQKAFEQSQEKHSKLQSDFFGKESELSALRQDLKVLNMPPCLTNGRIKIMLFLL